MRRVITGHDQNGKSVFISDEETSRAVELDDFPGVKLLDEIWATDDLPTIPVDSTDPTRKMDSFVPLPGGTRFRFFTILPEELMEQGKDINRLLEEYRSKAPGLGETLELDNIGMHTTDTIDYGVVLSGQVYLELDDEQEVLLKEGDIYVQNGTRHAWRNRSNTPCTIAVVMVGARRN